MADESEMAEMAECNSRASLEAFLDRLETPEYTDLLKELLVLKTPNHTEKVHAANCELLQRTNALIEDLGAELVRRLGNGE